MLVLLRQWARRLRLGIGQPAAPPSTPQVPSQQRTNPSATAPGAPPLRNTAALQATPPAVQVRSTRRPALLVGLWTSIKPTPTAAKRAAASASPNTAVNYAIGTGSIVAPVGLLSGAGNVAALGVTGTGSITAPAGALAAAAIETFVGTGAIAAPAGALSANARETITGTGGIVGPAGLSGSGAETIVGTESIAAAAGALSSNGEISEPATGDGGVVAPAGQLSGDGIGGIVIIVPPTPLPPEVVLVPTSVDTSVNWPMGWFFDHASRRRPAQPKIAAIVTVAVTGAGGVVARTSSVGGQGIGQVQIGGQGGSKAPVATITSVGRYSDDSLALWLLGWNEDDAA